MVRPTKAPNAARKTAITNAVRSVWNCFEGRWVRTRVTKETS